VEESVRPSGFDLSGVSLCLHLGCRFPKTYESVLVFSKFGVRKGGMMDHQRLVELAQLGSLDELTRVMLERYPSALRNRREELVFSLIGEGLAEEDAELVLRSLEEAKHMHLVNGDLILTRHAVSMPELLRSLEEEYPEFVGQAPDEPREEMTEFIAVKMGLDADVAREVLEDLEAAGYATVGYDRDYQRDRVLLKRP
jgi:hypothetical protein